MSGSDKGDRLTGKTNRGTPGAGTSEECAQREQMSSVLQGDNRHEEENVSFLAEYPVCLPDEPGIREVQEETKQGVGTKGDPGVVSKATAPGAGNHKPKTPYIGSLEHYFDLKSDDLWEIISYYQNRPEYRQVWAVYRDILKEIKAATFEKRAVDVNKLWRRARKFRWSWDYPGWPRLGFNGDTFERFGPWGGADIAGWDPVALFDAATGDDKPNQKAWVRFVRKAFRAAFLAGLMFTNPGAGIVARGATAGRLGAVSRGRGGPGVNVWMRSKSRYTGGEFLCVGATCARAIRGRGTAVNVEEVFARSGKSLQHVTNVKGVPVKAAESVFAANGLRLGPAIRTPPFKLPRGDYAVIMYNSSGKAEHMVYARMTRKGLYIHDTQASKFYTGDSMNLFLRSRGGGYNFHAVTPIP